MKGVTDAVDGNRFSWHLDYVEFPFPSPSPRFEDGHAERLRHPSFSINTSSTTVIELGT
jgi:hypothetical protein